MIDCLKLYNQLKTKLKTEFDKINKPTKIVVIIANDNNDELVAINRYLKAKSSLANELNITIQTVYLKQLSTNELINTIKQLNNDNSVNGYILQFPMSELIDINNAIEYIDYKKDIEGISYYHQAKNILNSNSIIPCTAQGIIDLLEHIKFNFKSKNVVIINRSMIIGKPLMNYLINQDCTISVCHSKTKKLKQYTINADLIITATDQYNLIKPNHIKNNVVIIDAGFQVINNKICGDINYQSLSKKTKKITVVPNGVGKLTVINLFFNLLKLLSY